MTLTIEKPTQSNETVAASINERKLLGTLKHLFATSYSMLGELMQNARRAGATRVDFLFDFERRQLEVIDDGCGIDDFSTLLALCDSGWDEQTMLTDKPFGMGFFSVFYACEKVQVFSNGKSIEASLDDIVNRRQIRVQPASEPVKGTRLVLTGLGDELMGFDGYYRQEKPTWKTSMVYNNLRKFAMGFPITVTLNGEEFGRPHAQNSIVGTASSIGFVHDEILNGMPKSLRRDFSGSDRSLALYLQGLPINGVHAGNEACVIHLDSTRFIPVMPDRARLYDSVEQMKKITKVRDGLIKEYLCKRKTELSSEEFVAEFWDIAEKLRFMEIFNDVPVLPRRSLFKVDALTRDSESSWGYVRNESEFVRLSEIESGNISIWHNVESDVANGPSVGVLLKIMQRENIHGTDLVRKLDAGHWLHQLTHNFNDLEVAVESSEPIGQTGLYLSEFSVELKVVDSFSVTITSRTDPAFRMERKIEDDWVVYMEDPDDDTSLTLLWTKTNGGRGDPVDFMCDFRIDDSYDEHWNQDASREFSAVRSALLGADLVSMIERTEIHSQIVMSKSSSGTMALAFAANRWNANAQAYQPTPDLSVVTLEDAGKWQTLAERLAQTDVLDGQALKAAFADVFGVKANIGGPEDKS